MKSKLFGMVGVVVLVLMLVGALFPLATPAGATAFDASIKPIIFVHGSAGSGAQFESQAMRFASNGYPANYIFGFDYDSTFVTENITTVLARLDAFVDACRTQTGADKVYMLGHSLGTSVMIGSPPSIPVGYLGVPERAAKVAKYVNIDGRTATSLPGGVPTLALWAAKGWSFNPANKIVGATNVLIPNQTHVQIATSAESFVEIYKFFIGNPPATNQILPQPCNQIQLTGRAVFFPQNIGVGDATLEIWKVNGATGARIGAVPQATYTLTGGGAGPVAGAWGPFNAEGGQNYEFVILRTGFRPHHFYLEPFIRSDYLVRLLTSPAGGIGDLMERNMNSAALVISRNKEFWGDQGPDNDILTINGTNIINAATCPVIKVPGFTGVIGIFAYDRSLNGLTSLSAPIPLFFATGFMTGVDIYIPAADPPNGTISLVLTPRGGGGKTQTINMPNWASLNHSMSAPFNDFVQTEPVPVLTATGAGAATFSSDLGNIACLSAADEQTLPIEGKPAEVTFPYGLFSLKITGITPGSTVTVTITLPSAPSEETEYWKYQEGIGWYQIPIISRAGNVITIRLTDGGRGDADGVADGTIIDPGGLAFSDVLRSQKPKVSSPSVSQLPRLPPADVRLNNISVSPGQTQAGQPVTVLANVVNNGLSSGSYNVMLRINGKVEQQRMIEVSPGTAYPVQFTVAKSQPGTYDVAIEGQRASFTVLGGDTSKAPASSGLMALLVMAVLVLATVVVLILSFRRPA